MHPDAPPGPRSATGRPLRVATYNLYLGADLSVVFDADSPSVLTGRARQVRDELVATDFPSRAGAIADLVVREQVDVVGLQEVARWSSVPLPIESPGAATVWCDFLPVLLAALTERGATYDVHASNATFSGRAAVSPDQAMSVVGFNVILVRRGADVAVTAEQTGAYATTLQIPTGMPELVLEVARGWGVVDATVAGRPFRFVNTHTEAYDEVTRDAQRDELLRAVGDVETPMVVVGDFNAVPAEVGMPADLLDAWDVAGGRGSGATCGQRSDLTNPVSELRERIDYVWVRGASVTDCHLAGATADCRTETGLWPSDHACVVADLLL